MSMAVSDLVIQGGAGTVKEVRRQIRVVKPNEQSILPDRKEDLMRRLDNVESALGRMLTVIREIRADVTHLTVEK